MRCLFRYSSCGIIELGNLGFRSLDCHEPVAEFYSEDAAVWFPLKHSKAVKIHLPHKGAQELVGAHSAL